MKKPYTKESALIAMGTLCARSEQCEADIVKKLRLKGLPYPDIQDVIAKLRSDSFIDDHRFARSFANDKVRFSAWGRNKIRLALITKRIESEAVAAALQSIDETDYKAALARAAQSKVKSLDLQEYDDRLKLYKFLVSRGFESALASREVKRLRMQ